MKKLLLGSVATGALLAAGSANAADLAVKAPRVAPVVPPPPVFSWTGCYVGAHVGWGWGRHDVRSTHTSFSSGSTSSGGFVNSGSGNIDTSGAIFGGQVGCDYQFGIGKGFGPGAWVIGIQGDLSAADINGFATDPLTPGSNNVLRVKTISWRVSLDDWGSLRLHRRH